MRSAERQKGRTELVRDNSLKKCNLEYRLAAPIDPTCFSVVRRQGFWNQRRPNLRESLAHLVDLIMRLAGGDASVAFRASFV